ncbi:MAG: 4Fe-4S binding protein, partial [Deltaproteobacteria bacterium]|nr:4Fe-4S binding protein [Deltaproteobacteria bacterium]
MKDERIMMGNEALGRGLVECGCGFFAAYPGTPSSEILASAVGFAKETNARMHLEWSVNEKVAYEAALAHSYTGKRSAVAMKQVGLNVAADPFMRSAYMGVVGGFVLVAADDPGPHSSQTEQDSRFFALFAKIPVLDPSSPAEAKEMVPKAFELSEKYETPVMIRPTTRVCHARQNVACRQPEVMERTPFFKKDPGRWIATPQFIPELHRVLNEKIEKIARQDDFMPRCFEGDGSRRGTCIIASGVAFAHVYDLLDDMGLLERIDLFQVALPYPLHQGFVDRVRSEYEHILVVEETYPVIETQLLDPRVKGRISGLIPKRGELTPDIVQGVLDTFLSVETYDAAPPVAKGKRPSLCAGCPHRAAYYAIKTTFPGGIFPSDIGCYTLAMNFDAIDTCHCMGACINQGTGFYFAYAGQKDPPPIVVSIGDSTFFHAGIPGLINAVFQKARFILVILDNATTAMTGNQPTPQVGIRADGSPGKPVFIPEIVKACGVDFIRECDPYDVDAMRAHLREADRYCRSSEAGIAVVIAKHPCILDRSVTEKQPVFAMEITDDCTGCETCLHDFECPALIPDEDAGRVVIDENLCVGCGVCVNVCPVGAITAT